MHISVFLICCIKLKGFLIDLKLENLEFIKA